MVAWKLNADDLQTVCFPQRPGGGQAVRQICTVEKITHGRCKVEGTGAGEVASGTRCLESRSSWRGAEVKCNAKVTQSELVEDELEAGLAAGAKVNLEHC